MYQQKQFTVKGDETFQPVRFISVKEEIALINERTAGLPVTFKANIIITFLKDHSLLNEWIKANPLLTKAVTGGSLFTGAIEALFAASKGNVLFQKQLETFLITHLTFSKV